MFVLLGAEAIRTFKSNPYFSYVLSIFLSQRERESNIPPFIADGYSTSLGPYKIPTWTSPLIACIFVSLLVSNTSFLGHVCAVLFGYARKFFFFFFWFFPFFTRILKSPLITKSLLLNSRPWISESICTPRENPSIYRR